MEQATNPTQKSTPNKNFKIFTYGAVVVLAGVVAWLVYQVQNPSTATAPSTAKTLPNSTGNIPGATTVKSGKGAFELSVPDGWGPLIKPQDSDRLIMTGTTQPTLHAGNKTKVTSLTGYGSDSPIVFMAVLEAKSTTPPQGDAEPFTAGKEPDAITGTKYTYIYPKDTSVGIGYTRFAGDRDYEYVLPHGEKELHVFYSVYGSDPRNLSLTVDTIVQSIKFL